MINETSSGVPRQNLIIPGPAVGESKVRDLVLRVDDLDYASAFTVDAVEGGVGGGGASADTAVVTASAAPGALVSMTYLGAAATGLNYTDRFLIAGDNVLVLTAGTTLAVVGLARTAGIGIPSPGVVDTAQFPYRLPNGGYPIRKDVDNDLGFGANSYVTTRQFGVSSSSLNTRVVSSDLATTYDVASVSNSPVKENMFVGGRLVGTLGHLNTATNTVTGIGANVNTFSYVQQMNRGTRYWFINSSNGLSYLNSNFAATAFATSVSSGPSDQLIQTPDHVWFYRWGSSMTFRYKPNDTTTALTSFAYSPLINIRALGVNEADASLWFFSGPKVWRVGTNGVVTTFTPPWANWAGISISYATGWGNNRFLIAGSFTAAGTGVKTPCLIEYTTSGNYSIVWADAELGAGWGLWVHVVNNVAQWIVRLDSDSSDWLYEAQLS